jgi:RNA polymerase sigma factor (sigma-70 family)
MVTESGEKFNATFFPFSHLYYKFVCCCFVTLIPRASSNRHMEKKTDEYYIREILKGDSGSFSQLVEKYSHLAFSLSMKILNQREEAEEAAQDAFIKAYNSLGSFQSNSTFKTWFFRIVYNTSISRLRTHKNIEVKFADVKISDGEIQETESAVEQLNKEDRQKYLIAGLERLEPDEQTLLKMYYYDSFSIDEIGVITGMTVSNVKVKIHRSRKRLLMVLKFILKDEVISIL